MDEKEAKDGVERIEGQFKVKSRHFHVNDMPTNDFELFQVLARDNFCNHYGLTISFLMKQFLIISPLVQRMDKLELELTELKANKPEEKPKGPKMMNGKVLGEKK